MGRPDTCGTCGRLQGATWQQAVQWVTEVHVQPGMVLPVLAKHDTYGVSFVYQPEAGAEELPADAKVTVSTGVSDTQGAEPNNSGAQGDGNGNSVTISEPDTGASAHTTAAIAEADDGASSSLGSNATPGPAATGVPLKVSECTILALPGSDHVASSLRCELYTPNSARAPPLSRCAVPPTPLSPKTRLKL